MKHLKGDIFRIMRKPPLLLFYLLVTRYLETFLLLILKYRLLRGKEDKARVNERKGLSKFKRPKGKLVWFNTASIGEVLSIIRLIELLAKKNDLNFLITSTTVTSAKLISTMLPKNCQHQFTPIDTFSATKKFLNYWNPDLAIFVEGELWPRLILEIKAQKIPLGLINARMESRSFSNWKKASKTAKVIMEAFNFIFAQDSITADRLLSLGAAEEVLLGVFSLKEKALPLAFDAKELERLKRMISNRKVWIAASTHPGEEEIVARTQQNLYKTDEKYLLILIPRHPERGKLIGRKLSRSGLSIAVRSEKQKVLSGTEIYLADTLGELGLWYALSDIVFLGGSLVDIGGHNPFEPGRYGTAIIHGPHTYNFKDIFELLDLEGASRTVTDSHDLFTEVHQLSQNKEASRIGKKGLKVVNSLDDKSDQIVKVISSFF